jgi:hypothetical protein
MTTVKELIEALSGLPQNETIICSYWTRTDIDELLEEIEHKPLTTNEWLFFRDRVMRDTNLFNETWNTIQHYTQEVIERRGVDSE